MMIQYIVQEDCSKTEPLLRKLREQLIRWNYFNLAVTEEGTCIRISFTVFYIKLD